MNLYYRRSCLYQYGFTLIELMIVIVIVAIISAVAVMSFSGMFSSSTRVGEQLQQMISAAQSKALLGHRTIRMMVANRNIYWQLLSPDKDAWLDDGIFKASWVSWQNGSFDKVDFFDSPVSMSLNNATNSKDGKATIQIMSNGSVTPFKLTTMHMDKVSACWQVDQYGVVTSCLNS